ncbi:MAG: 1-acyl-sn-glycerol-3-phosphate acyltransferase, partial [Acidimicrobiales bacterium]
MGDRQDGVLRRVARVVVRLVYRRVDILHADRLSAPGPMLVVANHFGGVADAVLVVLASSRRPRIVAADRIWKVPLVGRVLDAIGAIPIHQRRDGAKGNQDAFASSHRALAEGSQILIFPEGVTSEQPSIAQVRTGAAR